MILLLLTYFKLQRDIVVASITYCSKTNLDASEWSNAWNFPPATGTYENKSIGTLLPVVF